MLFFNKKDILQATLTAGISVKKYVPSYEDGANEINAVTNYFWSKFRSYHRKLSPYERLFLFHQTTAIDTAETGALLMGVRDTIMWINLQQSSRMI